MSKYRDNYSKVVLTPAEAAAFSIETGFYPEKVSVLNLKTMAKMEWFRGMEDDTAIVTLPVAASAAVGDIAADEDNEGSGTSPAMAGTYTGKGTGVLKMTCVLAGNAATAKFDCEFPDGQVVKAWVTGATTVAKEVGQGVTFAITSGSGDDCDLGDVFTSALVAGGTVHVVPIHGITPGIVDPNLLGAANLIGLASGKAAQGIRIGLNTSVNILSNKLLIAVE